MQKNRIVIEIMGATYAIVSEDPEEYILETAMQVEKKIKNIINNNPKVSIIMASNLACMDLYDEAKKAKSDAENLRSKINEYTSEINKLKTKLDYATLEINKLNKDIENLNSKSPFGIGDNRSKMRTRKNSVTKNIAEDIKGDEKNTQIGFFDTKKQ